jgi:hypothetical protein
MSKPRVTIDKHCPEAPIRVEYAGSSLHYTRENGHDLYEQLGGILMELDPPPTNPPPAGDETPTNPGTPDAVRRASSGQLRLDLPHGIRERVEEILEEGRTK